MKLLYVLEERAPIFIELAWGISLSSASRLLAATTLAGALAGSAMAQLWSRYALHSDGKPVARGINSIQAIKEAGGWRVTGIMVQAESATAPLPKEYLP